MKAINRQSQPQKEAQQTKRKFLYYMLRAALFKMKHDDALKKNLDCVEGVLQQARRNVNLQQELHNEILDISSQSERGAVRKVSPEEEGFRTLRTIQEENDDDDGDDVEEKLKTKLRELERVVEILKKNEINIINRYKIELKSLAKSYQDLQTLSSKPPLGSNGSGVLRETPTKTVKKEQTTNNSYNSPDETLRKKNSVEESLSNAFRQQKFDNTAELEHYKKLYEDEREKLASLNIKFGRLKQNLDEVTDLFIDFQKEKKELAERLRADDVDRKVSNDIYK